MTFLGLDVGSSSVKAQLIDANGRLVDFASSDTLDLIRRPLPTWAERDAGMLWETICRMLRSMKHLDDVEALCIAATSGSVLAVDRDLRPISPILLYSDKRGQEETARIKEQSYRAREYEPYLPLDASLALPKILWLKKNLSDFSKIGIILHETDYVQAKLTGQICTSPSVAGKTHVDVRSGIYLEDVFRDVGLNLSLMPPVKPIGSLVGELTEKSSQETGIARRALVANGVTDATAADIAAGTFEEGQVNASLGSSLVVHAVTNRVVPDPERRIYYKSYVDGKFLAGGATDAGTLPLSALANLMCRNAKELEVLASSVPPACEGLLAQPQWIGSRIPYHNPGIRGFFVGITEQTLTQGHLYRSLLEGNAFVLRQTLEVVREIIGLNVKEIRTTGGGSKSDIQNKIIADVLALPVLAVETSEASLGAAMLAFQAFRKELPLQQVAKQTIKIRKKFAPDENLQQTYDKALTRFVSGTEALYGKGVKMNSS